eukprot:CAMPEP_0184326392 /NCGR_PEP_ID=MMETSP1049-20130417/142540_1 /TAXON_ID=77928 /ORGANISM="Proteomonas sulcata, Strain CCMP704" /LENGTH=635 /DNA_ID=CAMNT_0026648585 /DNA_START=278 /DNA_END=2187 /DNA_ORIENTATION=+
MDLDSCKIQVSAVMGLEALVKQELNALGFEDALAKNGRVELAAKASAIPILNIQLRTATRVLLKVAEFEASTFDDLFEQTYELPWLDLLHPGAAFPVRGKSIKSTLHSVPACQSIVKKAITKKLLTKRASDGHGGEDGWIEEHEMKGVCEIEVAINKDVVTISLDTSGNALNRRGYRPGVLKGGAPLKENLAAAMLMLSRWTPDRPLFDPFCGSGTIALEAALMAHNIAPGLRRGFAAEGWHSICGHQLWEDARAEAEAAIVKPRAGMIFASDIDKKAVTMTYRHLERANLAGAAQLSVMDVSKVPPPPGDFGCIVTNPPYGMRLGDSQKANDGLARLLGSLDTWSAFILSGDPYLEDDLRRRATKRRKLYNGKLPCQLYQYFGPLPSREQRNGNTNGSGSDSGQKIQGSALFLTLHHLRSSHVTKRKLRTLALEATEQVNRRIKDWAASNIVAPAVFWGPTLQACGGVDILNGEQQRRSCMLIPALADEGVFSDQKERAQYLSMIASDGWCRHFDKESACCFLGTDAPDEGVFSDQKERAQYLSMIASDGWCRHFDKETRGCTIYDERPRFCRTEPKVFEELYGVPQEGFETAAIQFCLDTIGDLYGETSPEFDRYGRAIEVETDESGSALDFN